jgi:hypothetical protein
MEEIGGEHRRCLTVQELPPGRAGAPFRCRGIFSALRTRRMVDAPTRWPSLSSSPWIRWYPQPWFSVASRPISAAFSALTGRPSDPVRAGLLPGDQVAVPAQDGAGVDQAMRL